jgi:uncharacterized protein with HEPN domain
MSKRDLVLLLEDIFEAALKIRRYSNGLNYEAFVDDDKTLDAVVRNFEIIGEAANRLSDDFRTSNPQIEWDRIRGFSNRIVHDYFGIDYEIVWDIMENYLDSLIEQIEALISHS